VSSNWKACDGLFWKNVSPGGHIFHVHSNEMATFRYTAYQSHLLFRYNLQNIFFLGKDGLGCYHVRVRVCVCVCRGRGGPEITFGKRSYLYPGCEANHPPLSSAEMKNVWSCISTPP